MKMKFSIVFAVFVLRVAAEGLQPSVRLAQGTVNGRYEGQNLSVFLGIPYAATTAGENR